MAESETSGDWTPPATRGKWKEREGRAMVEALGCSGETQAAFARRHGLQAQRIKYWVDRVKGRTMQKSRTKRGGAAAVPFAPVQVVSAIEASRKSQTAALEIVVGAAVVRVPREFDGDHLRRVVAALGGAPC